MFLPAFGFLGGTELIVILIVVLIVFGPGKLPMLGGAIGQFINNFKKSTQELSEGESIDEQKKE